MQHIDREYVGLITKLKWLRPINIVWNSASVFVVRWRPVMAALAAMMTFMMPLMVPFVTSLMTGFGRVGYQK
ncbi:hypothetical protein EOPP23_20980 [Endozoicomonas sp. OPT23]|nr:hypothetical protein [Endozoicomonas sp. OPT23]